VAAVGVDGRPPPGGGAVGPECRCRPQTDRRMPCTAAGKPGRLLVRLGHRVERGRCASLPPGETLCGRPSGRAHPSRSGGSSLDGRPRGGAHADGHSTGPGPSRERADRRPMGSRPLPRASPGCHCRSIRRCGGFLTASGAPVLGYSDLPWRTGHRSLRRDAPRGTARNRSELSRSGAARRSGVGSPSMGILYRRRRERIGPKRKRSFLEDLFD
jgi:hypothetical protein